MKNVWMSWSSGKDSAFALYALKGQNVNVTGLITTLTTEYGRVAIHGVRRELLQAQAEALEIPLEIVEIPAPCSNTEYEKRMSEAIKKAKAQGVTHFAFGDLFLQDVRDYRERQLKDTGITPLFPLWLKPTSNLAREILNTKTKAILTCVDTKQLDETYSGREYDEKLLRDLPSSIDPCGERGEFHTFVYDSPLFKSPISLARGEMIVREGFAFTDLKITTPQA